MERCPRYESLQADLDAANRRCEEQAATISRQDQLILNLAEELNRSRAETVDAREHRDLYRRDLDTLKQTVQHGCR